MQTALLLGLGIFAACWIVHLLIWRIKRPEAYPIWLPVIFIVLPLSVVVVSFFSGFHAPWFNNPLTVIAALMLHFAISACYICGYAGIIEYSPSAEILREVRSHMPEGVPAESLNVRTLSEEALTGKRINHLINSNMIALKDGFLYLTPRGRRVVMLCHTYRRIFGIKEEARG